MLGRLEPHDMAFDVGYSRTVAEGLSVALTARYVRSEPGADDVATDVRRRCRTLLPACSGRFAPSDVRFSGCQRRWRPRLRRRKPSAAVGVEGGRSRGTRIFRSARPDTDRPKPNTACGPRNSAPGQEVSVPNTVVSEYSPCEEVTAWGIAVRENTATARPAPAFDGNMSRRTPLICWPEVHPPCAIRGYSPYYSIGNASFGSVF